ncbi:unnamed protein product [Aphanomyces euteiches]
MNLIQGKTNQFLREAILDNNVEKARKFLTLPIGKADVQATSEHGGFSMLHCAVIVGNHQMVLMLLQLQANIWAISDDGDSPLDLALWKGHTQIIQLLRSYGAIAPMREPESLNGKKILHHGREATVVDFFPSTVFRTKSIRALHYATGENLLVNPWAGTDYKIIGLDPNEEVDEIDEARDISVNQGSKDDLNSEMKPVRVKLAALEKALDGQAFVVCDFQEDDGDESDIVEQTIQVKVPPGPLGVFLDTGIDECAVVQAFTRLPNGKPGAIEASGLVKPGMYNIGINNSNASLMSLQQVIQLLNKLTRQEKIIRFAFYKPREFAPSFMPQYPPRDDSRIPSITRALQNGVNNEYQLMQSFKLSTCKKALADNVFVVINTRRRREQLVVKLMDDDLEMDFMNYMNRRNIRELFNHVVEWKDWGAITFPNNIGQCIGLVLEAGTATLENRLRESVMKEDEYAKYSCVAHLINGVKMLHAQNIIHGNISLDNILYFGDKGHFKFIDFAAATLINQPMQSMCTPEYCPPEMAKHLLNPTPEGIPAKAEYDIWSLAVVILKMFMPNFTLVEFHQQSDLDILQLIASEDFNFQ